MFSKELDKLAKKEKKNETKAKAAKVVDSVEGAVLKKIDQVKDFSKKAAADTKKKIKKVD